jgi:5'-3' exonuclease
MNSKVSFGGTAPKNIKKMITKYKSGIKWINYYLF